MNHFLILLLTSPIMGLDAKTFLPDIMYKAEAWRLGNDDEYIAVVRGELPYQMINQAFTEKQIFEMHPEFPRILKQMIKKRVITDLHGNACVEGIDAYNALEVLVNGYLQIVHMNGDLCSMNELSSIDVDSSVEEFVTISGTLLAFESVDDDEFTRINYVTKLGHHAVKTTKAYLSSKYPGWDKRLEVVRGLDLGNNMLMTYVFLDPPAYTVALENITFLE